MVNIDQLSANWQTLEGRLRENLNSGINDSTASTVPMTMLSKRARMEISHKEHLKIVKYLEDSILRSIS